MLVQLVNIIAPVALCAGLGFIWARIGAAYEPLFVTRLISYVGAPALIVSSFDKLVVDLEVLAQFTGSVLLYLTLIFTLTYVVLRILNQDNSVYLPPVVFANNGNMGLPLCLIAFGEQGLTIGLSFFIVSAVAQTSLGILIVNVAATSIRSRIGELLQQPIMYAGLIALLLVTTDFALPLWMSNTLEILAGTAIPLMLITLGVSLANLKIADSQRALVYSCARLGGGFLLGLFMVWLFDLEGVMRGVMLIQCTMPAAVINYLFALQYGRKPEEVAGIVVLSTLLSFATMPLLISFALAV